MSRPAQLPLRDAGGHVCRTCSSPLSGPLPAKCKPCHEQRARLGFGAAFCGCDDCRQTICTVCNGQQSWSYRCGHCGIVGPDLVPPCPVCGEVHTTRPSIKTCPRDRRAGRRGRAAA